MGTRKRVISNHASARNALEAAQQIALEREERRRRSMFAAWASAAAIALVGTVALLEGCGHQSGTGSASDASESPATQQAVTASTESGGSIPPGAAEMALQRPAEVSDDLRALPPDMVVAVSDTFVAVGQPVEVSVEGTPDITEMALSDGRGEPLPMVRDSVGNVWRVGYRVPLRPQRDRIGLSVTARNDQHRWRRVWLFLQVEDGSHAAGSSEDDNDCR